MQARKSSPYVLNQLVPALRQAGLVVEVQTGWVDDLVALFNRSTVYLYDSAEYWRGRGVTEGFGLPPLEALACGCVVFSSLNHALADILTPGEIGHQIGCGSLDHDLHRIANAVSAPTNWTTSEAILDALLKTYSEPVLLKRWQEVLQRLEALQPTLAAGSVLRSRSLWRLRWTRCCRGLSRVVNRLPVWPVTRVV